MAATFRSSGVITNTPSNGSNVNVPSPSGVQNGDYVLLCVFSASQVAAPNPVVPSGFTLIRAVSEGQYNGGFRVYGKIAASEPAEYAVSNPNSSATNGRAQTFAFNVNGNSNALNASSATSVVSGTSLVMPTLTTTVSDTLLVNIIYETNQRTVVFNEPASMQERDFYAQSSISFNLSDEVIANAGAVGNRTYTTAGSVDARMISIALAAGAGANVAPSISTQPTNQTVTAPNTATFTVTASGTPSPTYQWQRNPGGNTSFADIASATSSSYTTPATSVTGGTANNGDTYRVVVTNSEGSVTSSVVTLTVNAPSDTTRPTLTGSITVGTITTNSIQISWPTASDNVAVTSYEVSKDNGSSYTNTSSTATSYTFTALSSGTAYNLAVRAKDAAGNVSTPALTATATTTAASSGTLDLGVLTNNTNSAWINQTGITVHVYALNGTLVVTKSSQTTNSSGQLIVTDAAFVSGTTYRVVVVLSNDSEGLGKVQST